MGSMENCISITGATGEKIDVKKSELKNGQWTAIRIVELNFCEVVIMHPIHDVHADKLMGCRVFIGPTMDVAVIEGCTDCVITVAAQRVELINCENCVVFAYSSKKMKIENSNNLLLAPYNGAYENLSKDFHTVNLDPRHNCFKDIKVKGRCTWDIVKLGPSNINPTSNSNSNIIPDSTDNAELEEIEVDSGVYLPPLGKLFLRWIFFESDTDLDGGLSWKEVNNLMVKMASPFKFQGPGDLQNLKDKGIPLTLKNELTPRGFEMFYEQRKEPNLLLEIYNMGYNPHEYPIYAPTGSTIDENPVDTDIDLNISMGDSVSDKSSSYASHCSPKSNSSNTNSSVQDNLNLDDTVDESDVSVLMIDTTTTKENNKGNINSFNGEEEDSYLSIEEDEIDEIEKQIRLKMRQADLYQKMRKDLKLDDDGGEDMIVDKYSLKFALEGEDKRYSILMTERESRLLLERVGDGDTGRATRERISDYFLSLRLNKHLSYKEWQLEKKNMRIRSHELLLKELQRALAGRTYSLTSNQVQSLLSEYDIIPVDDVESEALSIAKQWANSNVGRQTVRNKARDLMNAQSGVLVTDEKAIRSAYKIIMAERKAIEFESISTTNGHSYTLFLEYRKVVKALNDESSLTFTYWFKKRQESRVDETLKIKEWKNMKKIEERSSSMYSQRFILLTKLKSYLDGAIQSTYKKLGKDVYPSRKGLNLQKIILDVTKEAAAIGPASEVVSCSVVRKVLGSTLFSLYAEPQANEISRKLNDPLLFARQKLDVYKQSPKGQEDIADRIVELEAAAEGTNMTFDSDEEKRRYEERRHSGFQSTILNQLLNEFQDNVLNEIYPISGAILAAKTALMEQRKAKKERRSQHKEWLKKKSKQEKENIANEKSHQEEENEMKKLNDKKNKKIRKKKMKKWKKSLRTRPPVLSHVLSHQTVWVGVGLPDECWLGPSVEGGSTATDGIAKEESQTILSELPESKATTAAIKSSKKGSSLKKNETKYNTNIGNSKRLRKDNTKVMTKGRNMRGTVKDSSKRGKPTTTTTTTTTTAAACSTSKRNSTKRPKISKNITLVSNRSASKKISSRNEKDKHGDGILLNNYVDLAPERLDINKYKSLDGTMPYLIDQHTKKEMNSDLNEVDLEFLNNFSPREGTVPSRHFPV